MKIEEKILIVEIQKGNREVFESLFKEYYPVLAKFAENYVFEPDACEDIVQNLFIKLWEDAKKLNIKTSIRSYLFQSVKNRCLNYLRNLHVSDKHNLLYIEAVLSREDWADDFHSEISEGIKEAISKLPPKMAEILNYKYVEGKKINEISKVLNITENTVKTQLYRAKKKLRISLLEYTNTIFFL